MKSLLPISRIKWTNKNPNLENRIVKISATIPSLELNKKYHENFNVQHICI
jgi:hypothetical protein